MDVTATNPHPLANPLNQARYQNFAYGQNKQAFKPYLTHVHDAKSLHVPDAMPANPNLASSSSSNLTVPNSDVPYFNGPVAAYGPLKQMQQTSIVLPDGSLFDFSSNKIVDKQQHKPRGCWNDPNQTISMGHDKSWQDKSPSIEQILADKSKEQDMSTPNDDAYFRYAKKMSKDMQDNMSSSQKQLLDDLESGNIMVLSKLVEET